MPTVSSKQYGLMQYARKGKVPGLSPEVAEEFIHKTSPDKRKKFAKALAKRRGK